MADWAAVKMERRCWVLKEILKFLIFTSVGFGKRTPARSIQIQAINENLKK
jgi:hypothetical protein